MSPERHGNVSTECQFVIIGQNGDRNADKLIINGRTLSDFPVSARQL